MQKKYYLFAVLVLTFLVLSVSFVRAEDDEDEYDSDDYARTSSSQVSNVSNEEQPVRMVTRTIIVEPARIVTSTIMKDVSLLDADRDGIPDEQDLYPDIPEHLIVDDLNQDGIVDNLEFVSNP